jgi:hypothetical protein
MNSQSEHKPASPSIKSRNHSESTSKLLKPSRTGSIPDLGSGRQLEAAFSMPVGQLSAPTQLSGGWVVYKIVAHQPVIAEDLAKQKEQIEAQLLQAKQGAAFDAFRTALEDRLKREGKLTINSEALKRLNKTS